jgi:hypothetical protein
LPHRLTGGLARRQSFLGHDALDILHHHDRVVDQNADGEHHAEQGEHIDREPEQQKNTAGAEQRYHEIAEPDLVEAAVGRAERDDLQHRARRFLDQNALLNDGAREARLYALDAVLHLYRGGRRIRARNEVGGDLDLTKRVAG